MDVDTLAQKRLDAQALATAIVDRGSVLTVGICRHQIEKLASDLVLSGAMQETSDTNRRRFRRLETTLRPSARQRFVEGKFADEAGALLPSEERRIERDLAESAQADKRASFEKQRALLSRGSSALETRQKSRAIHSAPKMPVRRTSRKPAAKMWVTPQVASPPWPLTVSGLPPPALAASSAAPALTCPAAAARS